MGVENNASGKRRTNNGERRVMELYDGLPREESLISFVTELNDFDNKAWNDLFSIEGTDRIVKITFRLFDVTIEGCGLNVMPRPKVSATMKLTIMTVRPTVSL